MSCFRFREIRAENYRCFEDLTLSLEEDTTVLFAENGGGKTALLTALALGLAPFQQGAPKSLQLDRSHDLRMRTLDKKGRREPAGPCQVTWTASVGDLDSVSWSSMLPVSGRIQHEHLPVFDALERLRVPGERWPLFAWYGVDRLRRRPGGLRRAERVHDRWEGYESALDPNLEEAPLLQWLQDEMLGELVRQQQQAPERGFHEAVMQAAVRATPGVESAWYDAATEGPMVRFEDGRAAPWSELSDGYHGFLALVADIARRAVILNEMDGAEAPAHVEGVVLVDELDLHLHPRWQRVALAGLRRAFPRLQLVVTTHSPQVLSSAENRQVRRLLDGKHPDVPVFVGGRDSNAILREFMRTEDRDAAGVQALRRLYDLLDQGRREEAAAFHRELLARWGDLDPALIRAESFLEPEE